MSLPLFGLEKFKTYVQPHLKQGDEICLLSCPDIIARPVEIARLFDLPVKELQIRPDTEEILVWHKAHKYTDQVVDTRQLFELLGYKVTITDIVSARDNEIFLDLNKFLPEEFSSRFAFIFENVIDHCFNLGVAFTNAGRMLRKDGVIMHLVPLLMINHGFWSISPTAFYDYYEYNKFEILHYEAFEGIQEIKTRYVWSNPYKRVKNIAHDSMQVCIAKRTHTQLPIWPTQWKFRQYPESKK